jgi:nucleoside-diphosphate-sugar epimerase
VDETGAVGSSTETGKILLDTENLLMDAVKQSGFPAVILRVAGIYGPGRGYYLQSYLKQEARIEGSGDRYLNMAHRDDVAGAIIAAMERGRAGELYNVVDDEPVKQMDFYRWLAKKTGRGLPPVIEENSGMGMRRGVTNKRLSNRKLKTELGYSFQYPTFREGLAPELPSRAGADENI